MELDFEKRIVDIEKQIAELSASDRKSNDDYDTEMAELKLELARAKKEAYSDLTPWQTVHIARHPDRPLFQDYAARMFEEFIELHGDRVFGDDRAMRGGFAEIGPHKVMLIGTEKGRNTEEKLTSNFGMANPEGYRKALRLMKLAEKYSLPVVSLVDTPAAYPGMEAEQRGQAEAIARNLTEMAAIEIPILVVITGEGGSGGALGIAAGDTTLMLSNAIYSVIPPEGCAAILWRDSAKAPEAASALKLTASSLLELSIIDEIIPEPLGGAHRDHKTTISRTKDAVIKHLSNLKRVSARKLLDKRFAKYARIGKVDNRKYAVH